MIKIELENLKMLSGGKEKKKKKGKKKKGKKKKKEKPFKLLPKSLRGKKEEEMLLELVGNNICKKLPPQQITDFIGEFNYIASMQDNVRDKMHDPSMALIR